MNHLKEMNKWNLHNYSYTFRHDFSSGSLPPNSKWLKPYDKHINFLYVNKQQNALKKKPLTSTTVKNISIFITYITTV